MPASRSAVPQEYRSNATSQTLPAGWKPFEFAGFITRPQYDFICDMLDNRDLLKSPSFFDKVNAMDQEEYDAYIASLKEMLPRTTRKKASEVIEALKALPKKQKARLQREEKSAPKVPDGHYALEHPGDELNPVRFYKVSTGKEGSQWEGFQFVERYASDDSFPVKGRERYRVLEAIAANPLEAAQRYGREFQRCSRCNRGLTRRLSREMGIGPVCASRAGWVDDAYIEAARQRIVAEGHDPDERMARPRSRQHILEHS